MGVQFQARHDGVDQPRLPRSPVKAHRVDPLGRPFVYMAMDNRFARAEEQNRGGRIYIICVLILIMICVLILEGQIDSLRDAQAQSDDRQTRAREEGK